MAQNDFVTRPNVRYTRADFTSLRAYLNRIPLERIANLYYNEDDLDLLGITGPADLKQRLDNMRDQLVQRACDSMPHLADSLRDARKTSRFSKLAIDYLVQAADQATSAPQEKDSIAMWLKPRVAGLLKGEGAATIGDLVNLINSRGQGWWKPIPRIGEGKAQAIVAWLQGYGSVAQRINQASLLPVATSNQVVVLDPDLPVLVPFERISLSAQMSGTQGINRNSHLCLISARNDLQAIDAYLYKYRAQPKTFRAYQKELERFLLWCVLKRRKAMADCLFEDCEAFKDFIVDPDSRWIGPRAPRLSENWRPFAGMPSPASQRYAVQAIRSFFAWLVDVRYLSGNPWVTVADPRVEQPIDAMQIDKALPDALWRKLAGSGGLLDQLCSTDDAVFRARYKMRGWTAKVSMSAQYRLVRAVLLLLGESGLRREEAARASRSKLKPLLEAPGLWELDVLGKRNKRRIVFLPQRAIDALRAHWRDRDQDFEYGLADIALVSPVSIPKSASAKKKHLGEDGKLNSAGFSPDGLGKLVSIALERIAGDETLDLDVDERNILVTSGAHAFRHTFGTLSVARELPLDVLQKVLGHASLTTTTIYVRAEKKRSVSEMVKLHARAVDGLG